MECVAQAPITLLFCPAVASLPRDKISPFPAPATMQLSINGESREFSAPLTVVALLDTLGLAGKRIAVERNGEIVPKSLHGETALADGDRLEIVVAVGGG
jgi:sulfur carrier protein